MKPKPRLIAPMLLALVSISLWGCRDGDRQDTVVASASNPSHTYRATVILRQYFVDGKADTSPTTYVLLSKDSGQAKYDNGENFRNDEIVMQPSQCGPLTVQWTGDHVLKVICEKCGLALSAVGQHASGMGEIRIEYDGFPEKSSWETGPNAN